jgi:hypothetical protein
MGLRSCFVTLTARKTHEGARLIEMPSAPNETQPRYVVGIVSAKPGTWATRRGQQPDPLVIADRFEVMSQTTPLMPGLR